ncbi:MAG: DUF6597 domain-containing transcriptional factor, partial [Spirochaetota bacterium]
MDYYPLQIINLGRNRTGSGYSEYMPSPALREHVLCYWFFRRNGIDGDVLVNPDCCADIIFNLDAPSISGFSQITGTFSERFYIPGDGLNACGIRLRPGMMYHLIREGIDTLAETAVSASDYRNLGVEHIAENIPGKTNREIADFFDSHLPSLFSGIRIRESRFQYAQRMFNGFIAGEMSDIDVSGKTLDRYFVKYYGLTRKNISSILRFQNSLRHIAAYGSIVPEGYYDQPHFIKDFKRYSG